MDHQHQHHKGVQTGRRLIPLSLHWLVLLGMSARRNSHCCICQVSIEFMRGVMCGDCSLLGCASSRREVEALESSVQELRKKIETCLTEKREKENIFERARTQSEKHSDALRTLLLQAVQSVSHGGWWWAVIELLLPYRTF